MWEDMKKEYITNPKASYNGLAKKYGVNKTTVGKRASKEGWVAARKKYAEETLTKSLNSMSSSMAKKSARLQNVSDNLLSRVEEVVKALTADMVIADTQMLRHIAATIKDIKEIQNIKTDADIREQEARIKNLERQVEASTEDKGQFGVFILPPIEADENE